MKSTVRRVAITLALLMIATGCGAIGEDGSTEAGSPAVEGVGDDVELLALGRGDVDLSRSRNELAGRAGAERSRATRRWVRDRRWTRYGPRAAKWRRHGATTTTAPAPVDQAADGSTTTGPGASSTATSDPSDTGGGTGGTGATTTAVEVDTSTGSSVTSQGTTTQGPTTTRASSTTQRSTTTVAPTTSRQTTTSTTSRSTTTAGGGGTSRFATLPPGSSLPSGASCAARVRSAPETRSGNASYNRTRGSGSNGRYPRVDGDFVGTTDEIIQWAACKWGIDEDWARAQAAKESWWDMTVGGDRTSNQSACHPDLRTSSGTCPESIGLLQVRYLYHSEAFANSDAIRSTAYNVDYTYAVWRSCYEGELDWLNTVDRGRDYAAGDLEGCLGVWFSGRWYTAAAVGYIDAVRSYRADRVWEQQSFLNY